MASILAVCSGAYTPKDRHNLRIFNVWIISAGLSFASTTFLVKARYIDTGVFGWGLALLTLGLSILAFRSYLVFLRGADELLRRIQLEGLALGFGAGGVFMLSYRLFERLGAPKLDSVDPFAVMMIFWAIGQYIAMRRYGSGEER
jgi:hypothetical protein